MDTQAQNEHATGLAICDVCGETKRVCCGEFKASNVDVMDVAGPAEYEEAMCIDCCPSQRAVNMSGVGDYSRTDCGDE